MTIEPVRWMRQLRSAVLLNARDVELWSMALNLPLDVVSARGEIVWFDPLDDYLEGEPLPPVEAAQRAALLVRTVLPYRFTGAEPIYELAAARKRKHGACGDASAAVVAAVLMVDGVCDLCYETTQAVNGYAHVRVVVAGVAVDAYPDASYDVDRCSAVEPFSREAVRWPTVDALNAFDSLDGRRRRAGRR